MKYLKSLFITTIYIYVLILYFVNDSNKNLIGVIFDSFGISCFAALYFLFLHFTLKTLLPDKFFEIRRFERLGKLYKVIGVGIFKFLLQKNLLPPLTGKFTLKKHSFESLIYLEKQMRSAETIHFLAFLTTIIIMIPFGLYRDVRFFYFIIVFNTIVNLYPTLVQRYNRNRIHKILNFRN